MANPAKGNPRFNTFGALPRDANRQLMSSHDNYFVTEDATGTPVTSPTSVSNLSATTLNVPAAAAQVMISSSVALRVSEDSAMSHYMVIPANTPIIFPCLSPAIDQQLTNTGALYLQGDSGAATVQFRFDCI